MIRTASTRPRIRGRHHRARPQPNPQPHVQAVTAPPASHRVSRSSQLGRFALHYAEMCVPMCIGFAVGDALYFWLAGLAGYPKPFSQLPELSLLIVTVAMTAPMSAWMAYRGMPRRRIVEMSVVMPALAFVLLFGWSGIMAERDMVLTEHALMMPAMLIPMLLGLEFYSGRATPPARMPTR